MRSSKKWTIRGQWAIILGRQNGRLLRWRKCSCVSAKTKYWTLLCCGPPEFLTLSYCAWLWNWLISQWSFAKIMWTEPNSIEPNSIVKITLQDFIIIKHGRHICFRNARGAQRFMGFFFFIVLFGCWLAEQANSHHMVANHSRASLPISQIKD